jgi:hypothetical protein
LLCLSPGLTVPSHPHPVFEITPRQLLGKAHLPTVEEGDDAGAAAYSRSSMESFSPRSPFDEPFEMLIHIIKR